MPTLAPRRFGLSDGVQKQKPEFHSLQLPLPLFVRSGGGELITKQYASTQSMVEVQRFGLTTREDKMADIMTLAKRIAQVNAETLRMDLEEAGNSVLPELLSKNECQTLSALYKDDDHFRSHIKMARHGFGKGEYKYLSYPLPGIVHNLRELLYPLLVTTANSWNARMGIETVFPPLHGDYVKACHEAGQMRPTPLLLQYVPGDFNCLHQDVYGDLLFPLQVAVLLSEPENDFSGGEFVLTEQRPRMQSRAEVVPLRQGDAVVFAVRNRPVAGTRGDYRVNMRHGVSKVRSGKRHTLGIIFHDAA